MNACVSNPGEITVTKCAVEIKSIELQLVRVETCKYMEGEAKEATEIQNIQIADGNVVRGLAVPIHMVFPRLFTCSTCIAKVGGVCVLSCVGLRVRKKVTHTQTHARTHTTLHRSSRSSSR